MRARGGGDIRDVNTNSENWAVVKGALVAGMYPNLVHVDRENLVLTGPKEKKVRFHPTSVLSQPQYKKVKYFSECITSKTPFSSHPSEINVYVYKRSDFTVGQMKNMFKIACKS